MNPTAPTSANSDQPRARVLVAEDDETSRNALVRLLQREGYDVTVANDGQEAIHILLAPDPPHIALLDWAMPRLDGIHVCLAVRSIPSNPYTYIVMVTGRDQATDALAAFAAGVDDFLSKPLDSSQLLARLRCGLRVLTLEKRYAERSDDLERTREEVRNLKRLLPICTECRQVRDDADFWEEIDAYRSDQTGTYLASGICHGCKENLIEQERSRDPVVQAERNGA
jgi:phosphoserine phosphatase RsbU/P